MSQEKKTLVDSLLLPEQLERNKLIKGEQGSIPPESAFKDVQTHLLCNAVESVLNPAKEDPKSADLGHDISTNGRGHKKVVTGKAGNQYPVAKRKGVR
jgi:hypothetical protein